MIHYVVAFKNEALFKKYLMPCLSSLKAVSYVVQDTDPLKAESIFKKYNSGIDSVLKNTDFKETDVVAFIHEDVRILDDSFIEKVETAFRFKGDIGVAGVVGTNKLIGTGAWWHSTPDTFRGHVVQEYDGGVTKHLIKGPVGYFDDLVMVDGLCLFVRGKLLLDGLRFDGNAYDEFDFYDADLCFSVLKMGYKIACLDILLHHKSMGNTGNKPGWLKNRDIFLKKVRDGGYNFPLTSDMFKRKITTLEV
jgi:hypothetical protein